MSKVLITKSKLDDLATAISAKSGASLPLTLAQMETAVGNIPSGQPTLQSKTKSYTPTETAQSETVEADSGYDGLEEVSISVGAVSSTYVGSGIARRDSTNLSASGDTVTVPGGYYESLATKAVASGTAGTPTATKGTVSNHSISVTPSVTNTTGYITGSTKTGTAVTVSASELVSGTYTVDSSGTKDVTNYASASVPAMTLPTASSATSSGTSKATITPTSSTQYLNIPTGYNGTAQYYTIAAASGGSVTVKTTTMTNNSATATSIQFTSLTGQPKAFFCRCTSNLSRSSSNRYYYIADIRWDGSSTGGVVGNKYYVYNGQYSNQTTGYSQSYSNNTLTLTTTGSQTASPGSFYNGTYELVYIY